MTMTMTTKLPRTCDGVKLTKHPVLIAAEKAAEHTPRIKRVDIARMLGVSPQSALGFEQRAQADRDYQLPAEHVKVYARIAKLPPYVFRPDVFKEDWTFTDDDALRDALAQAAADAKKRKKGGAK